MLSPSSRPAGVRGDAPRTTSSAYCANGARNREASSASTRADSLPSTRAAVSSTRSTPTAWGARTTSAAAQHTRTKPRRRTTTSAVPMRQVLGRPIKTGARPGMRLDLDLTGGIDLWWHERPHSTPRHVGRQRRSAGPGRGLPHAGGADAVWAPGAVAPIRTLAVPLCTLRRLERPHGLSVRPAEERDLDGMAALWRAVAPLRQLAPVLGADDFRRMCAEAPGLARSSYWIARHAAGHLAGFVALWDQQQLKHTVVQRYALRAALFRYGIYLAAALVGSPRLPAPGTPLRYLSAFQVCVPATDPGVLRVLLVKAARAHEGSPYAFCSIGLDVTDPLTSALAGCWAQTTLVHAHVGA